MVKDIANLPKQGNETTIDASAVESGPDSNGASFEVRTYLFFFLEKIQQKRVFKAYDDGYHHGIMAVSSFINHYEPRNWAQPKHNPIHTMQLRCYLK